MEPDELLATKARILGDLYPREVLGAIAAIIKEDERCGNDCDGAVEIIREQWSNSKVGAELSKSLAVRSMSRLEMLSLVYFLRSQSPDSISVVAEALAAQDKQVVLQAILTARALRPDSDEVVSALEELVFSDDSEIRRASAFALIEASPTRSTDLIEKISQMDRQLADQLRQHQIRILLD